MCHLDDIIRKFKADCTRTLSGYMFPRASNLENNLTSVFEDGYHDRILMKEGQLDKMLNYVSDNPRRRFLRRMNPYFNKRRHIIDGNGNEYETYGNLSLLDDTDIEAVRISSKFSAEELRQRKLNWKRTVENCGVLASPFISEAEKKVRDWALENGGCLIYIETTGLGPCFTPKGRLHELYAAKDGCR